MKKTLLCYALCCISILSLKAQTFIDVGSLGTIPARGGTSKFGDLDNDGDYDLVTTGSEDHNFPGTHVYLNSNGSFVELNAGLANFGDASLDLADFDGDGDLDISVRDVKKIYIYRNDNLTFTLLDLNISFNSSSAQDGLVRWIDLNNDGMLELVSMGDPTSNGTYAYVASFNNGGYKPVSHNLGNYPGASLHPADFNKDGRTDLLINFMYEIVILLNKGDFQFEIVYKVGGFLASAAPGDFNNDGYVDFIVARFFNDAFISEIFLNNKNGNFMPANINLPGHNMGDVEVADFNMDGLDDFFLNGSQQLENTEFTDEHMADLFLNMGNMTFQKESYALQCRGGNTNVVDFNNDSRPDLFITGYDAYHVSGNSAEHKLHALFYTNVSSAPNTAPVIPQITEFKIVKNALELTWKAPSDDTSGHLKYNVRIGTSPDAFNVLNPFTRLDHALIYNSFTVSDTFSITTLAAPLGYGKLYAAVQAIDNSFHHSTYSEVKELQIMPQANFSVSQDSICAGQTVQVQYEGPRIDGTYYRWSIDANVITPADPTNFTISLNEPGLHTITLVAEGGGYSATSALEIFVNPNPELDIRSTPTSCFGDSYQIEYTGSLNAQIGYFKHPQNAYDVLAGESGNILNWNFGGTHNISFYIDANGCRTNGSVAVTVSHPPARPEICIVTSSGDHNELIWTYDYEGEHTVNIYRETHQQDNFELIGTVSSSSVHNSFMDQGSLIRQQSYRYRLAVTDTCGSQSVPSRPHKTIHLTINKGQGNSWNLIWNPYQGFAYATYRIYRGTERSSLALLTEIPSNVTSFTDFNPHTEDIYYQIEVVNPNACDDGRDNVGGRTDQVVSSSRSNVAGSQENEVLTLYPNPVMDKMILSIEAQGSAYIIIDNMGKIVETGYVGESNKIDIGHLEKFAFYFVRIQIDGTWITQKMLKN